MVARSTLRDVHPLHSGRCLQWLSATARRNRMDYEPLQNSGKRIPGNNPDVQPCEIRCRSMGENGERCRYEILGDYHQASRRFRHVQIQCQPVQHRRFHPIRQGYTGCFGKSLPQTRNYPQKAHESRMAQPESRRDRCLHFGAQWQLGPFATDSYPWRILWQRGDSPN